MADSADAAAAEPAQAAEEAHVSGDFSLVPLNAEEYASKCLPLVPELRARLAASLSEGAVLWGAELLNAEDEAGTHVLAKCAPSRKPGTPTALLPSFAPAAPGAVAAHACPVP